jgi:hypothetical protein
MNAFFFIFVNQPEIGQPAVFLNFFMWLVGG